MKGKILIIGGIGLVLVAGFFFRDQLAFQFMSIIIGAGCIIGGANID
jgi:hypothetical protein